MEILIALLISIGINLLMFIPAFLFKTDKLTDLSYAITFIILSLYTFLSNTITTLSVILTSLILIWAIRLGSYLFIRIRKTGKDTRFNETRESFWRFGRFWLLQGITVWIILIPSIFFYNNEPTKISFWSFIGISLWIVGFGIETIADRQKFIFKNNPDNKDNWINTGLWKYSRHPNYFGEILLWTGLYIYLIFSLTPLESIVGIISPLYIFLIIFFVSGIPPLEKSADQRFGAKEEYINYKKQTRVLLPFPVKK